MTIPQTEPRIVRWSYRTVNGIFVAAILGTLVVWFAVGLNGPLSWGASYVYAYPLLFSLMLAGCLLVVLVGHAIARRTVAFLKWPFVLGVLTWLVVFPASEIVNTRLTGDDTVVVTVHNETPELIQWFEIFGRGDYIRIEAIPTDSAAVIPFRGRKNDYNARNPHSNRVSIAWYTGGRWRERRLVHPDIVIGDSIVMTFVTADSIVIGAPTRAKLK